MAIGTAPQRPVPHAYTIYIGPSQELTDQSWHWPQAWHDEFVHARWRLGLGAAWHIARGGTFDNPQVSQTICGMSFVVERNGNSFYITIVRFEGPEHDPSGPKGGTRQPAPAGQLVIGLRGVNRYHHVVVFQGVAPPTPGPHSRYNVVPVIKVPAVDRLTTILGELLFSISDFENENWPGMAEVGIHKTPDDWDSAWPPSMNGPYSPGHAIEFRFSGEDWKEPLRLAARPSHACLKTDAPRQNLPSLPRQYRRYASTQLSFQKLQGSSQDLQLLWQSWLRLGSKHGNSHFQASESYLH